MLREIRLRNLAIVEDVSLSLTEGFNALTGSTGAGKSLVVEAVRWLRGEKVEQGLIRSGCDVASAEALIDLSARQDLLEGLSELGLDPPSDGLLHLRREVRRGGRSRAFIDGRSTSAAHLASLCDRVIQLQSQHQQRELLDPARHVAILDACGVDASLRREYELAYDHYRECANAVAEWLQRRDEIRAQREILEFQHRELEAASLEDGEMERLGERVALLSGGARLVEAAKRAQTLLEDEEHGALSALSSSAGALDEGAGLIADLGDARDALLQAQELAAEATRNLERFADAADVDPAQLDADQARLAQLQGLCRKYGRIEHELLEYAERLREELAELESGDEPPTRLTLPLEQTREELACAGKILHEARKKVGRRVARQASSLLVELGMPEAEIVFELIPEVADPGDVRIGASQLKARRSGVESTRLLVRTNKGEALGPVERVASGGELSRLGLILKSLAITGTKPALLILDEVDAGLGADLGAALARRLTAMAQSMQILAITHMPAVAAAARRQLGASKSAHGDRTLGDIQTLRGEARLGEIIRMIGGPESAARRLAKQLLPAAAKAHS